MPVTPKRGKWGQAHLWSSLTRQLWVQLPVSNNKIENMKANIQHQPLTSIFMCVCAHTDTCTCIHMHIYVHTLIETHHTCTPKCTHMCIHTCMYIQACTHKHIHAHKHTQIHVSMHTQTHAHTASKTMKLALLARVLA